MTTIITSFVAKYLNPNTIFRRKQWTWQQSLWALSQNTPIQIRDSPGHNNNSDKKASRNKRSKNTASSNKEPDCWLSSRTITPGFTSVLGAAANIFFSSRALKTTQIHRSHLFLCVCGVFFYVLFLLCFFLLSLLFSVYTGSSSRPPDAWNSEAPSQCEGGQAWAFSAISCSSYCNNASVDVYFLAGNIRVLKGCIRSVYLPAGSLAVYLICLADNLPRIKLSVCLLTNTCWPLTFVCVYRTCDQMR